MEKLTMEQTAQVLRHCENALILIHRSPDGDCIGGGYGLARILQLMGKRARVLCNDQIPDRYAFLLPEEAQERFEPEFVIAVDVADEKLLGQSVQTQWGGRVDLCIDHHVSNTGYAAQGYVDGSAAAACEIIQQMLHLLPAAPDAYIAQCLYTGIATDTGCFQFENTTAQTHRAAMELMTAFPQIPYAKINRAMFALRSMGRLQLEKVLIDRIERYRDGACSMIFVEQAFIQNYHLDDAELESLPGFPLQIEGTEVGVTVKEREPGVYRVSMRSAEKVNVSKICARLGGGGHIRAAGCQVKGTPETVRAKILQALDEGWDDV